jgi:hypothetical protein
VISITKKRNFSKLVIRRTVKVVFLAQPFRARRRGETSRVGSLFRAALDALVTHKAPLTVREAVEVRKLKLALQVKAEGR